jgi:hypothetical protein
MPIEFFALDARAILRHRFLFPGRKEKLCFYNIKKRIMIFTRLRPQAL